MSLEELNAELEQIRRQQAELADRQYELSRQINEETNASVREYIESGQFLHEYHLVLNEIYENDIDFIVNTDKTFTYQEFKILDRYYN